MPNRVDDFPDHVGPSQAARVWPPRPRLCGGEGRGEGVNIPCAATTPSPHPSPPQSRGRGGGLGTPPCFQWAAGESNESTRSGKRHYPFPPHLQLTDLST